MVWTYRLLVTLAGGVFGVVVSPFVHHWLVWTVGLPDDAPFWILLGLGCAAGLLIATLTYSQSWFHWACVVVGPAATAICVWRSLANFAKSESLKGTGPFAGLGEVIYGLLGIILAAGFVLLAIAGGLRLFAARRKALARDAELVPPS